MSSDVKRDIIDSIEDIGELLSSYELLFAHIRQHEPDHIELAALGTVLHSFYNGIEGIFLLIAKQVDKDTPTDPAWHQTLMNRMTEKVKARTSVLSAETADRLAPYMKFRHFFRHAYAFRLDWRRLAPLVDGLDSVWNAVKKDIAEFLDSL